MALPWKGCYSSCSSGARTRRCFLTTGPLALLPGCSVTARSGSGCASGRGGFDLWRQSLSKLAVAVYAAVGKAGSEILPPARGAPPPGIWREHVRDGSGEACERGRSSGESIHGAEGAKSEKEETTI